MKVKFRDNYLIYRTSVEEMMGVILTIAQNDGEEEEAVAILKNRGWSSEELKKFDNKWDEALRDINPSEINTDEVYKIARDNIDLTQFWGMK